MPVTGRRGLYGCEMLKFSHELDNRLIDGAEVRPMHLPRSALRKIFISLSGTNFWSVVL
jgi:hypothetical protein